MLKPVAQVAAISNYQKKNPLTGKNFKRERTFDREKLLAPPRRIVILPAHLTYGTTS
jgi:hypothetical protein